MDEEDVGVAAERRLTAAEPSHPDDEVTAERCGPRLLLDAGEDDVEGDVDERTAEVGERGAELVEGDVPEERGDGGR